MAIDSAIASMGSSNAGMVLADINTWSEIQAEYSEKSTEYLSSINDTLLEIWVGITDYFEGMEKKSAFAAGEATDPGDLVGGGTSTPTAKEGSDAFSLVDFFKALAGALAGFVGTILPAIIASLSLSNMGFTGLEFKALNKIKGFFSGQWWTEKVDKLAKIFRENKAVIAIKEFFEGGKIQKVFTNAMKNIKMFFSLEGDGIIAKIFQGIKGMGGKIVAVMGKIFYPISLLMSAFDGFMVASEDYKENESIISAGVNFVTGFFASFIGTFVDLIKDGIMWLVAKMFGIEMDENGNFDKTSNPIMAAIDNASFADAILDIGAKFSEFWSSITDSFFEWWENFSFMDLISGDASADDFKMSNGKTYGKREDQTEQLTDAAAENVAGKGGGGVVQINAPQNSSTTTNANQSVLVGATASAGNPIWKPKRSRG